MLTKSSPISTQSNLFHSELFSQLDVKDPMVIVGFIVINQFVVWFLRVDYLCKGLFLYVG
jgi:hypothetical protein